MAMNGIIATRQGDVKQRSCNGIETASYRTRLLLPFQEPLCQFKQRVARLALQVCLLQI